MKDSANCLEVCELVSESDCVISFYIGFNMDMKVKLHGNTVTEKTVTIHTRHRRPVWALEISITPLGSRCPDERSFLIFLGQCGYFEAHSP